MKRTSGSIVIACLATACIIEGAGCFKTQEPYVPSPNKSETLTVPANSEGAKASTGGIQTTITPQLGTSVLVNALPDDHTEKGFIASMAEEKMNPVPMQDGTRTEFTTVTKTFTKNVDGMTISIQTSLTDTRSIPVLTAFINSYSEFSNELTSRKKVAVEGETAWFTYSKDSTSDTNGYGSVTMLYRNRFLIQIDGNLGVTQDDLLVFLKAYHFDQLK